MIINKVHIDKFGKFEDYTIDFNDHCNVVYGCNEDGKSTVMNFIKMMFYGNPGRSGDIAKNIRKRYQPWSGAKMSGYIEFVSKGIPYKLIRSFGNSNATDRISLWNLASGEEENLPMKTDPGLKFFGIGAAAFEKSVFIGQIGSLEDAGFENDKDDEITQKLLNLVTTGDETVSFKKVDTRIQNTMDALKSKRGKIGIIDKKKLTLIELTGELNNAKTIEQTKKELEVRMDEIRSEIKKVTESITQTKISSELQELVSELEVSKKILEKKGKIDELSAEFKRQFNALEAAEIDLDGVFVENCQEVIDSKKAAEKLFEERTRALAGKIDALDKLKAVELQEIPEDYVNEVKSIETEIEEMKKSIVESKDRANEISGFLNKKKAVDEIRESFQQNTELLEKEKVIKLSAETRFEKAKSLLERARRKLDEEERDLVAKESAHIQARTDFKMAQQNTSNVKALTEQKLEGAKEKASQAETPKKYSVDETRPAKPSMALLLGALLIAVVSIILGILVSTFFYAGIAIAAIILGYAFTRKETVTRTTTEVDEAEVRLAKQNLENIVKQTESDLNKAFEDEENARLLSEGFEREFNALDEKFNESKRSCTLFTDEFNAVDKELSEVRYRFQHLQDALESISRRQTEKESELTQLGFTATQKDLDNLIQERNGKNSRLETLTADLREKLDKYECKTSDEIKALFIDIKNNRKSIEEKTGEVRIASDEVEEAKRRVEERSVDFLALIGKFAMVSDFEQGLAEFENMKNAIEKANDLKIKIDSQSELLVEELGSISAIDREADIVKINDEILKKNNGIIPLKMSDEEIEQLKSVERQLLDDEKGLTADLIKIEAEVRNSYKDKRNVSQVEDDIYMLKREIELTDDYYEILEITKSIATDSFNEIRQSFGPILNNKTGDIFKKLTGDKYKNVMITRNFDINVQDVNSSEMHEWKYLSSGTIDQAYLSLRLAVSDVLNKSNEDLPILLDDVFVQYDDERARKGLEFISDYSSGGDSSLQIILFTCHNRIVEWAKNEFNNVSVTTLA